MAVKTRQRPLKRDSGFAVAEVNLRRVSDRDYVDNVVPQAKFQSERAWKWHNNIGEIRYSVSRSARIAGYSKLFPVELNLDGSIKQQVESGLPVELVSSIFSPYGGVRGLIERFYTLMKVPADAYLIRVAEDGFDGFHFLSPSELNVPGLGNFAPGASETTEGGGYTWTSLPQSRSTKPITKKISRANFLGRAWAPSSQYVDLPDSPLHALDAECELLYTSTQTLKAKMKSRLAMAGLLFIPSEIQKLASGDKVATSNDSMLTTFVEILTRNVNNWDNAAALAPILLRGPGDAGDKIRWLQMERDVFQTDLELRRELVDRILFGLDIQKQATTGENQSHFAAWSNTEDERRIAVQPDLETMCWVLTRLVLHRGLKAAGWGDDRILRHAVWYDLDRATTRTNRQEDARQAGDRILISETSMRRDMGYDETDIPDDDEMVRRVGVLTKNPVLALWGNPNYDEIDWKLALQLKSEPGPTGAPSDEPTVQPGEGEPGSPDDRETDTPRTDRPA